MQSTFKTRNENLKSVQRKVGKSGIVLSDNRSLVQRQEVIQAAKDWKTGSLEKEHKAAKEYPESYLWSGLKAIGSGVLAVAGTAAGTAALATGGMAAAGTLGIAGTVGAVGYGAYNLWNRYQHGADRHTLHHKVAKSKLEDHYDGLSLGEKAKMKTSMGLQAGDGGKAIKSFRPNLTLGRAPEKRSIKDPGEDFDGNVQQDGSLTPRSRRLREVDRLLDKPLKNQKDRDDINQHLADSLAVHVGGMDTTSNKTELDKNVKAKSA